MLSPNENGFALLLKRFASFQAVFSISKQAERELLALDSRQKR
jgi:hypothetical protein